MPPQNQALMEDTDLKPMPMNLKEGDRYFVNSDEGLTVLDFDDYVILAEKRPLYCEPRDGVNAEEGSAADLVLEVIIDEFLVGVEPEGSAAGRGRNG
ncbi:hypothetical protein BHE74_00014148 [Ensete ventricosum]|nr:hypothetical protein BHE74_00014148 [Ensete ventricosum]